MQHYVQPLSLKPVLIQVNSKYQKINATNYTNVDTYMVDDCWIQDAMSASELLMTNHLNCITLKMT